MFSLDGRKIRILRPPRRKAFAQTLAQFAAGGRICTSRFGELHSAARGGGELPTSLCDVAIETQNIFADKSFYKADYAFLKINAYICGTQPAAAGQAERHATTAGKTTETTKVQRNTK